MSISCALISPSYVRAEHDDVQSVRVGLDLGALIALEDVLDDQRMQAQHLGQLGQRVVIGRHEVDPDALVGRRQRFSHLGDVE